MSDLIDRAWKRGVPKLALSFIAGATLIYIGRTTGLDFLSMLVNMEPLALKTPLTNEMVYLTAITEAYAATTVICLTTGFSLMWGVAMSAFEKKEEKE